jgi:hypothetical protein
MDILTPKGQITREQELRAKELFEQKHPTFRYIETPKDQPALVDALLMKGDRLFAVAETKCRQMTLADFRNKYASRWLITLDKVMQGREIATALCVPYVGLLYLVPDDVLLVQRIWNADGTPATNFGVETTSTQATVNGGKATRANAYVTVQ